MLLLSKIEIYLKKALKYLSCIVHRKEILYDSITQCIYILSEASRAIKC